MKIDTHASFRSHQLAEMHPVPIFSARHTTWRWCSPHGPPSRLSPRQSPLWSPPPKWSAGRWTPSPAGDGEDTVRSLRSACLTVTGALTEAATRARAWSGLAAQREGGLNGDLQGEAPGTVSEGWKGEPREQHVQRLSDKRELGQSEELRYRRCSLVLILLLVCIVYIQSLSPCTPEKNYIFSWSDQCVLLYMKWL